MRQIRKETFYNFLNLSMSVYWAMYYFEELEQQNKKKKKSVSKNKKITAKVKIKKDTKQTTGKEKRKSSKNDK